MSELRSKLRDQTGENKELAGWERWEMKDKYAPYNFYGSSYEDYEIAVGLPPWIIRHHLDSLAPDRRYALDVGADPSALRQAQIPGITIGLYDTREEQKPGLSGEDTAANRHMMERDIIKPLTWIKLRQAMHQFGFAEFPLITMVLESGLRQLTDAQVVHFRLLDRLWSVLDHEHGLMIIELQERITQSSHHPFRLPLFDTIISSGWVDTIAQQGIKGSIVNGGIILERSPYSPNKLPPIDYSR